MNNIWTTEAGRYIKNTQNDYLGTSWIGIMYDNRMVWMCCHVLYDWIWIAVTIKLNLLQTWKVFYSRKRYQLREIPNYVLKLRSSSILKMDRGDVWALDNKVLEILELIILEGEPHFYVWLVPEPEAPQAAELTKTPDGIVNQGSTT